MTGAGLQAVIFDVDGLLVDTETCDYEAWRELYQGFGEELCVAQYCHHAGMYGSWEQHYAELAARWSTTPEALHARRQPLFLDRVSASLDPSPGLLALLTALTEAGVRRGVASSSDTDWVEYLLNGMGLLHRFQAVATGPQVLQRKPAPDVYLLAAERLDVDPANCVALEDSSHGIAAARAAGMRVVAVPNSVSAHQDLRAADTQVGHLGEIGLALLRSLVER
jgi:HAD superfamily hydrolase (TIGR01509 family)